MDMSWEEAFAEDNDPRGARSRTVTVGWTVRAPHAHVIWAPPRAYEQALPKPKSAKSVQLCPAAIDFDRRPVRRLDHGLSRQRRTQTLERQQRFVGNRKQQAVCTAGAMHCFAATRKAEYVAACPADDITAVAAFSAARHDVVNFTRRAEGCAQLFAGADFHVTAQQRRRGGGILRAKVGGDVQGDQPGRRPGIECAVALGEKVGSIHRIGALAQGLEACNGWAFWHVDTPKGLISIDALRAEIRAEMATPAE